MRGEEKRASCTNEETRAQELKKLVLDSESALASYVYGVTGPTWLWEPPEEEAASF